MLIITILVYVTFATPASDLIKLARIQYCGCKLAYTQTLCVKLDDCRWQNLQCVNITGIP